MDEDHIIERVRAALPDAEVDLSDLTGTGDHWQARVVSSAFEGTSQVTRHRMVYQALREELRGPIHALALQTLTPAEAAAAE